MRKLILFIVAFITSLSSFAQNDEVNNQVVLDLLKEGFNSQEIIGAIETSSTRQITWSIDFMRELKKAGADAQLTETGYYG